MLKHFFQNQSLQIQKYELNGLAMKLCIPANLAFRSPPRTLSATAGEEEKAGFSWRMRIEDEAQKNEAEAISIAKELDRAHLNVRGAGGRRMTSLA